VNELLLHSIDSKDDDSIFDLNPPPLKKKRSSIDEMLAFQQQVRTLSDKMSREIIDAQLLNPTSEDEEDCAICYENKICSSGQRIDTFVFNSCEHRFCQACVKENFKMLIESGEVLKLNCLKMGCGKPATDVQLK
jgi:hypothetical protein